MQRHATVDFQPCVFLSLDPPEPPFYPSLSLSPEDATQEFSMFLPCMFVRKIQSKNAIK